MSQKVFNESADADMSRSGRSRIYKIGGTAALIVVLASLLDLISTLVPGWYTESETVADWFRLFQDHWLLGLRDLGLLDVILATLNVPLFFALYIAHRRRNGTYALLAAILSWIGTAIFLSNNVAFPMFELSKEYAAATTETQRSIAIAAGRALLSLGEHSSPGTFMGYLFINGAGISMALVMLESKLFGKITAWAGILGFSFLLTFNICAAFIPAIYDFALALAGGGGLLFIFTYILIARRLFQLD